MKNRVEYKNTHKYDIKLITTTQITPNNYDSDYIN